MCAENAYAGTPRVDWCIEWPGMVVLVVDQVICIYLYVYVCICIYIYVCGERLRWHAAG